LNNITYISRDKHQEKIKVEKFELLQKILRLNRASLLSKFRTEKYENTATVSVRGEVQNPGIYPVNFGQTRLKDVIAQAGGFTNKAYLPLAYITRRQEMIDAYVDYRGDYYSSFQYSDLTMEDTTRFYIDMMLKKQIVSCDFFKAIKENSEIY
jgi:NADH:ubiquinone oxidoreductase subunit F (NADH-binding)